MFLSTYKSTRVFDRQFLAGATLKWRCIKDHIWDRGWNGIYTTWMFSGDMRMPVFFVPLFYNYRRFYCYMNAELREDYERQLLGRHGPSLEDVNKNLSKADQEIALAYAYSEKWWSVALPIMMVTNKPAGCNLPGADH